ncbi:MAG: twin-arginine translocase TatA/TatE family subunit [Bdellovibrionales bacterium]|nr:twin-arginine translocase TatA/TatE family subunit [Bdellovibrionales bacterium]
MFGLGFGELILILLIALIFIGPKKLPELAKGLGKGLRDFQNAAKGFSDQMQDTGEPTKPESHEVPKLTDASQQKEANPSEEHSPRKEDHHS